jgi:hypothetical protein
MLPTTSSFKGGKPVLSQQQIDYFRTFGFVALPGLLGDERTEALRDEVSAALHDAYAANYDERVINGISGHYLPMASRLTPLSTSLICDDPLLIDAAEELLEGPVLPTLPEGVLYFAEAGWHDDDGIGVAGVKFATYFNDLDADNGALRFVPCSQHVGAHQHLRAYQAASYRDFPGVVVESSPGDVVAFDLHTFHASFGGRDRLAWAIEYVAVPKDERSRQKVLTWTTDYLEQAYRGFDRERYPAWRDWLANAEGNPRRAEVVERMCRVGILGLPGTELGW